MRKIVHICLCGPMTDGFSYQENLLAKYHKKLGYEVSIITSEWIWGEDGKLTKDGRSYYRNEYDIPVFRLSIKHDKTIEAKFKRYTGLYRIVEKEKPEVLFIHGCQFLDLWVLRKYIKKRPGVQVFIDNHADFSNSGTNFLSRVFLHKGIWKAGAKAISPYVQKFYGVLPARVDFLINMYGLSKEKTQLLVMGADDELVEAASTPEVRNSVRNKLGYSSENFVMITGGKIDYAKRQTLLLMEAVQRLDNPDIRLVIFGSVEEDIKDEFRRLCNADSRICYIGWIKAEDTYPYFAASDLAVFPGRHSVMWEQAAGQGIPMVVKYWEGTTHVDVGGNVRFLYQDTTEEIMQILEPLITNSADYASMKKSAMEKGKEVFSYCRISKRAIDMER